MALTDRQKEIKSLLDQGKTPKEIGNKLGISENAVYQQRRRIKAAQANGRKATSSTTKRTSTARKTTTTRRAPRQQRPALAVVNGNGDAAARATDPLEAVRNRKQDIAASLTDAKAALDEAAKAHEAAQKAYAEAEGKVRPELEKLDAVEALLTGKLKPPTKAKAKAEKPAEAPAPAPEPTPAPAEPEPEQAPVAAEATAQDQAAEAPDEPTEVQPSGNGQTDLGEERPGVPTMPEFAQEDAFAS